MKNSILVRKIYISAFSLSILLSTNGCGGAGSLNPPVPVNNTVNTQTQMALSGTALIAKGPDINKNRTFKTVEDITRQLQVFQAENEAAANAGGDTVFNNDGSASRFLKNPDGSVKGEIRLIQKGNILSGLILDKNGYLTARVTRIINADKSIANFFEDSSAEYIVATDGSDNLNTVLADNLDGTVTVIERDQFSKEISRKVVNKPLPYLSKFDDKTGLFSTSSLNEDGTLSILEVDKDGNRKKLIEDQSYLDSQRQFAITHY